ncbi:MAG TPA: glycosyl hydrolase [Candidatus Polarisedimenticolia bacterium]|jgi:hypothetical protein|nr:glycosyl hydrolase [Candidatus Polarisedimenticolia bacterium]
MPSSRKPDLKKGAKKPPVPSSAQRGLGKAARVVRAAAARAARASSTLVGGEGAQRVVLFVGTRKGAWILTGDEERRKFRVDGPHFLGCTVNHVVLDPRDRRTLLASAKTGHLGPTIYRSSDLGRTWAEATRPPAFPRAPVPDASEATASAGGGAAGESGDGAKARAVDASFWLTPGHPSQPEVWWAGTVPHGLFCSHDGGVTWDGIEGFNRNPAGVAWDAPGFFSTPDGAITHSVLIDPRDADHMYVGLSIGGLFETFDGGVHWSPLNQGVAADFLPDPTVPYGHDPHCVALHPKNPDRLYQANHCGIYRLDRPATAWERIGRNMPADIGDIGFPIVLHPRDPDTAWVFPMDGTTVWPRTSPGGRPAVYRTRDAGATWERQDAGLPRAQGWFTVKRQAMASDARDPVGLYFGTTSGEIWGSADEGKSWRPILQHLPTILSVVAAEVPAAALA